MANTTEAATLCANPNCTRVKHHPGLCTDDIAARTGLTIEQVQTVLDFEADMAADNPQNIQADDQVSLTLSEYPDPVTGTVVSVYRDAIGGLTADIQIGDDIIVQCVRFLTRVDPNYAQTVTRLAREYRTAQSAGHLPSQMLNTMFAELHAAAERAGISEEDANGDLWDEIDAG